MNILVVDDERNIRLTLRDILQDEGHQVFLAESAEMGLKILADETVDFVILDVRLPNMNGVDMFREIRKTNTDLDVLMISGHSGIETAVRAVKLGAYDFLEKPLALEKILTAVRNIREKIRLKATVQTDQAALSDRYRLIGNSPELNRIKDMITRIAPTEAKVLIRGESGTGKELVAYAIHRQSQRRDAPFIRFNSAAIPNELVESELFGHEKGAFTGADARKIGKLELAHRGTLFLDEIGDMDMTVQAKILRVIQEGTFERVGGNKTLAIDTRILAATHKDLEAQIQEGRFREDLFFRLNVIPITLPPLRERTGDIPILVQHFLHHYARELKIREKTLAPDAMTLISGYEFSGNVRELKNIIERLCILVPDDVITASDLAPHFPAIEGTTDLAFLRAGTFKEARMEFERYFLREQLKRFNWNISAVANHLGMHQPNLSRKIKELGLEKPF